jgi:hypothetical protein
VNLRKDHYHTIQTLHTRETMAETEPDTLEPWWPFHHPNKTLPKLELELPDGSFGSPITK